MSQENLNISDEELDDLLGDIGETSSDVVEDDTSQQSNENDNTSQIEQNTIDENVLNVPLFVKNIEKYYLGGLINKAMYINDDKLTIVGADDVRSIYAVISSRQRIFNKHMEFGIFDTSNMMGLLNLFSSDAVLDIKEHSFNLSKDDLDVEISLADSEVINGKTFKIPNPEKHIKEFDMELTLTKDVMDKILKSISAFPSTEKNFYLTFKRNKPKLVIGDDASKSNKVNIDVSDLGTIKSFNGKIAFFIKYLKHVLNAVKGMDRVTMKMSVAGVLIVDATDESYSCRYLMGADTEQTDIK